MVFKSLLLIICTAILLLSLTGCVGVLIANTGECNSETLPWPTKEDYVKQWGKPDKIIEASLENEETWIYDNHVWCGVMPCLIACAPLILPVCDGFNRVYFQEDVALRLHTRTTTTSGFLLMYAVGGGPWKSDACLKRIPPRFSLIRKIKPDKTVSISVVMDTPEHQQNEDYQKVAKRLHDELATGLLFENGWGFKSVLPASELADFDMAVTITSVNIPSKLAMALKTGTFKVQMNVRITDRGTNKQIGDLIIIEHVIGVNDLPLPTVDVGLDLTIANTVYKLRVALSDL